MSDKIESNGTVLPEAAPAAAEEKKVEKKVEKKAPEKKVATSSVADINTYIPLKSIDLSSFWNRTSVGDIKEMVASMKVDGQLQALVVRPSAKEGRYILIDGRRRFTAMKEAGITTALVTLKIVKDDKEADLLSMTLNAHHEDNNAMDLARSFQHLIDEGYTPKEIAASQGKVESYVSQHLTPLKFPKHMQKLLENGDLTVSHFRYLVKIDPETDPLGFDKYCDKAQTMSAKDLGDEISMYVDKMKERAAAKEEKANGKAKSSKKGEAAKEESKPGRRVKVPDYTSAEIKAAISPLNKTKMHETLQYWAERLSRAASEENRKKIRNMLVGMEMFAGLRGEDD
jgi:ParB/RepB/Spo0J family partition protein